LEAAYSRVDVTDGARLKTARSAAELVQQLRLLTGVELVRRVAGADLDGTPTAAGKSLSSAASVASALDGFHWERLRPLTQAMRSEGTAADQAADVVNRLRAALESDEIVTPIGRALGDTDGAIFSWLANHLPPAVTPPVGPIEPPLPPEVRGGRTTRHKDTPKDAVIAELGAFLDEHQGVEVEVTWRVFE
jgi:hypothetical protein